jgi:hypothetical protein
LRKVTWPLAVTLRVLMAGLLKTPYNQVLSR